MKYNISNFLIRSIGCFLLTYASSVLSQNLYVHPLPQETIRIDAKYLRPSFTQDANVEMKTMSGWYNIFILLHPKTLFF